MKRFKFIALFVALSLCAMVVAAPDAPADPPSEASGTLQYDPPPLPTSTQVGQTIFIDVEIDGTIQGTLTGSIHENYTVVHHVKAGFNTYRGVLIFDGVVTDADGVGREGTLTLHTRGRQDPGMPGPSATPWSMSWVVVGGTGELEHVQGHGTGVIVGLGLVYSGQVHFAGN